LTYSTEVCDTTHADTALWAEPTPFKAPSGSDTHRPVCAPKLAKPPSLRKDVKKWQCYTLNTPVTCCLPTCTQSTQCSV